MHIEFLNGPEHPAEIEELFREYTDMLVAGDPVFASYLELQSFDEELRHLEGKYAPPEGCLYLLRVDGQNAGCGGMKRLDESRCELKRMYIRWPVSCRRQRRCTALSAFMRSSATTTARWGARVISVSISATEKRRKKARNIDGSVFICYNLL